MLETPATKTFINKNVNSQRLSASSSAPIPFSLPFFFKFRLSGYFPNGSTRPGAYMATPMLVFPVQMLPPI